MPTTAPSAIVGVFRTRSQADEAVRALRDAGFSRDAITLERDDHATGPGARINQPRGGKGRGGAIIGALILGALGALIGAALSGLVPGFGQPAPADPVAAVPLGAGIGAAIGGLLGGMIGLSLKKNEVSSPAPAPFILRVASADRSDEAAGILRRYRASDVHMETVDRLVAEDYPEAARRADDEPTHLTLAEERLVADKVMRDLGAIHIRKQVEEVPGHLDVELQRDEIEVERVPVDQVVEQREPAWEEDDVLVVPVYEEELTVVKQLVMREKLRIRRVPTMQVQEVRDTLRKDRLVIEDPDNTGAIRERYSTGEPATDGLSEGTHEANPT